MARCSLPPFRHVASFSQTTYYRRRVSLISPTNDQWRYNNPKQQYQSRQHHLQTPPSTIFPRPSPTPSSLQNKTTATSFSTTSQKTEPFYGSPLPDPPRTTTTTPHPYVSSSPNLLQRLTIAVHSATSVLSDPTRADSLAALGEVTGHVALRTMYDKMMMDEVGQRILRDRPLVTNDVVRMKELLVSKKEEEGGGGGCGEMTFGMAYARFMMEHGFDPEERDDVRFVSDPDLAYVMLRYRQCHDFWHALCGLPPTVLGELALKWVELIQTGLPVAALAVTAGPLRLTVEERDELRTKYLPWAINVGRKAMFLMNVYYEEEFDTDLNVLRERLGIDPAPR